MSLLSFEGNRPEVHPEAYVAEGAVLVGRVTVEAEASIWFNAVLRGDNEPISVGRGANVQDGAVVHTDPGFPCRIGDAVTVGHNAILHGCTVFAGATVGMGATVLNGAIVGEEALVAANALVPEGMEIPPRALVAGIPARVRRELTAEEVARFARGAEGYVARSRAYAEQRSAPGAKRETAGPGAGARGTA